MGACVTYSFLHFLSSQMKASNGTKEVRLAWTNNSNASVGNS
jgi:hypothetical protein